MTATATLPPAGAAPAPAVRSIGEKAVRGGLIAIGGQLGGTLLQLTSYVLLARVLSPDDYGVVGMASAAVGFAGTLNDFGLTSATIQRKHLTQAQASTVFWINLALSAGLTLALAVSSPAIGVVFGDSRVTYATAATSLTFLFMAGGAQHAAQLRRELRFGVVTAVLLVSTALGTLVAWELARRGAGYWALVARELVRSASSTVAIWLVSPWRPGRPRRGTGVRSMVRFGSELTGFGVLNYLARNVDNALIGRFWGAAALGIYSRAYGLLLLPLSQINWPLSKVALPALSRLIDDPQGYRRAYLRAVDKVAMLTIPGVALLIVCSDWFIDVLLGPKWAAVAVTFRILGVAGLMQPVTNTVGWLFASQGRTRDMLVSGGINCGILLAAIVAGLSWGGNGVALAYVVAQPITGVVAHAYAGRQGPVRALDIWKVIGTFGTSALVVIAALVGLRVAAPGLHGWAGISVSVVITVAVTLVTLAATARGRASMADALAMARAVGRAK
jgi:PST family polysaccharide transporter